MLAKGIVIGALTRAGFEISRNGSVIIIAQRHDASVALVPRHDLGCWELHWEQDEEPHLIDNAEQLAPALADAAARATAAKGA